MYLLVEGSTGSRRMARMGARVSPREERTRGQRVRASRRSGEAREASDAADGKRQVRERSGGRGKGSRGERDGESPGKEVAASTCANETDRAVSSSEGATQQQTASEDETREVVATATLHIENFRRPFTLNAVKALVQQYGAMVDGGFWMNSIKTHCYVTYESPDVAQQTLDAVQGIVWPPETGQALKASFSKATAMEVDAGGGVPAPLSLKRKASEQLNDGAKHRISALKGATSIDGFFLKTETKPVLYYMPLTDEEVAVHRRQREQRKQRSQKA